ncbi:lipopolysaccharide transport periplasmic protein LptA, partial [bacterium]|nr:lipopolysaccharide transport periplasmic protein LptA [bacterium]
IHHADSVCYEAKKHTIILEGRVKIERMRDILNADKVTIYLDEGHKEIIKVVAEGNVTGRIFPEK